MLEPNDENDPVASCVAIFMHSHEQRLDAQRTGRFKYMFTLSYLFLILRKILVAFIKFHCVINRKESGKRVGGILENINYSCKVQA
jgi:hypothetical protein